MAALARVYDTLDRRLRHVLTARLGLGLFRGCASRRGACWARDARRLASAPRRCSRGGAATIVDTRGPAGWDELRQRPSSRRRGDHSARRSGSRRSKTMTSVRGTACLRTAASALARDRRLGKRVRPPSGSSWAATMASTRRWFPRHAIAPRRQPGRPLWLFRRRTSRDCKGDGRVVGAAARRASASSRTHSSRLGRRDDRVARKLSARTGSPGVAEAHRWLPQLAFGCGPQVICLLVAVAGWRRRCGFRPYVRCMVATVILDPAVPDERDSLTLRKRPVALSVFAYVVRRAAVWADADDPPARPL